MKVALQGRDNETFVKPAEESDQAKIKTILTSVPKGDDPEASDSPVAQPKPKVVARQN